VSAALDEALRRYNLLVALLNRQTTQIQRTIPLPIIQQYTGLGILEVGTKVDQKVLNRVNAFHDKVSTHLEQNAFLELCGIFEDEIDRRFGNAIGTAKAAIRSSYGTSGEFVRQSERLVRERESIRSMKAIHDFLSGTIDRDLLDDLDKVRGERNRLAHGTSEQPVTLKPGQAHRVLSAIIDAI
jgi:hypothetical protein